MRTQRGVSCVVAQGTRRVLFQARLLLRTPSALPGALTRAPQVKGQAVGEVYTCFPSHFCACHAFFYETVSKGETTCKHQLAASLAHTLGRCNVYEVSDVEFARLMELGCE